MRSHDESNCGSTIIFREAQAPKRSNECGKILINGYWLPSHNTRTHKQDSILCVCVYVHVFCSMQLIFKNSLCFSEHFQVQDSCSCYRPKEKREGSRKYFPFSQLSLGAAFKGCGANKVSSGV